MKITQKLCKKIGGHCWNSVRATYSIRYPDGSPRFRVCKHCGRKEDLTKINRRKKENRRMKQ